MRIASVSASVHSAEIPGQLSNPMIAWRIKHAVLVRLGDEAEHRGWGECWCFDAEPDALLAFLRTEVAPHLLGLPLAQLPELGARLWRRTTLTARQGILASAWSGVAIAAWDLAARAEGLPAWRRLAPDGPGRVATYASGGLYAPGKGSEALGREVAALVEDGFDTVKIKVGGASLFEDRTRVAAALDALPPAGRLILDAVHACDEAGALALAQAVPGGRLAAFQSPVPPQDLAAMRRLVEAGVPVMALEAEHRPEVHEALIDAGAVRLLQLAPIACGGPARVAALAEHLRGTGVALSLEVSSTALALAAALHLGAALREVAHVEVHAVHRAFFERLPAPPRPGPDGRLEPPGGPGLGLAPPPLPEAFAIHATEETTA